MTLRKSEKEYWNKNWRNAGDGLRPSLKKNFFWKRLDKAFEVAFSSISTNGLELMEIGAGASEWLPKLHKDYHFNVYGLDYSPEGCDRAQKVLSDSGINGSIICCDMFNPPPGLTFKFDVVCSFGLVEHFSDTSQAVAACAAFAKPGGIVLTLIPNMTGLNGFFYKTLNKNVFDTHVPLTLSQLVQAHKDSGLDVYCESYLLGLPGVIDENRNESNFFKVLFRKCAHYVSRIIWWAEERGLGVPENRITSPYMICAAKVSRTS